MKINEIFYSIQGEGKDSGLPFIFIRTTGCNLRCTYCDTTYAYAAGVEMKISKILDSIKKYNCKNVCLTGGEPLIQNEALALIETLTDNNYQISVETNGSLSIKNLVNKNNISISLDNKCPSSAMHKKMIHENILLLTKKDQLKFIIQNNNDYEYAKKTIKTTPISAPIFFQPVWGTNINDLATWILHDELNVRLAVQLHKIIWGDKKGV
jgi:7-carboxy-7-deazaguanine synthase